jgi:hypothetical protein
VFLGRARGHHATETDINAHVTIRTKEPEVPDEFPPARLFLEDIEEIIHILVEAVENPKEPRTPPPVDTKTKVTITTKDKICDEVDELREIAKKTDQLFVSVERTGRDTISLRFTKSGAYLVLSLYTRDERLRMFHKLSPIFKRRNRWLATLVQSHHALFGALSTLSYFAAIIPVVILLNRNVPPTMSIVIGLLSAAIIITFFATGFHHSMVILRRSSEPSAIRQELLQRFPIAAISSLLTFLLTLLGFYIKHKYWP